MHSPDAIPSAPKNNHQVRDFILLVIGSTAIGNSSVLVRLAEADPAATAFWRMVTAIPVLMLWAYVERPQQRQDSNGARLPWSLVWPSMAAGFSFAIDMWLSNIALGLTTMTSFIILVHLAPVVVVIFAWLWFGEKPTLGILAALLLAILGAVLLVQSGRVGNAASNALLGDMASIGAAVGYAGFILALRRARMFAATGIVSLLTAASCAVFCLLISLATGETLWPKSAYSFAMLAIMGVVCHAFGQGLSTFSVGSLGASVTSIVLVYGVAVTIAGGWLLFNETPNLLQAAGGVLVLAAVIICRPK
ncbi:MAG: DMT family transporter [Beijerinckiaceae bacterium]